MHVVTGASSGIGRGLTVALAERGERVLAVARRAEALEEVADSAEPFVYPIPADVTTDAGRAAIVEAVGDQVVSSLVHGAGSLIPLEPWTELDPSDLEHHFRVHVTAPIALTRALLARGAVERLAIFDSYSASTPRVGWSAYGVMKAAAQMSARTAAAELFETAVLRIFPGAVETPLLRSVLEDESGAPAIDFYRGLEANGEVSDPLDVGRQIARILVEEPLDTLTANEVWHVGHTA